MTTWKKSVFKLDANHKWKAPPGYQIFVADWGAVQFNVPSKWVAIPGPKSFKFHDRQPPDDNCTLEVSIGRLPPIDFSGLPLGPLLAEALKGDNRGVTSRGEIIRVERPDFELVWSETRFVDGSPPRDACSRTCLARRATIQPLITMDFWLDDAERFVPVWDEVLRSLRLGEPVPGLGR